MWGGGGGGAGRVSIPFKQYPKIIFEYYAKINRKSLNKNPKIFLYLLTRGP